MKICVKGWSKINHSYSIVCRNELIEFTKLPIDLKFIETPYFNEKWNHSNNFHGFSEKNNKIISLINLPKDKEFFDIIYRFDFPFNFKKSNSKKLFIFATSEYQNIKNMFINEIPKNFQKRDDLKIITSSKWSKKGFVEAGFDYNQVEVISLGVNSDIFYPISLDKKNKIKKKLKFNEGDFVISNIGAMTNNKGIDLLIVAFAILKEKYKNLKLILKDQSNLYNTTGYDVFSEIKKQKNVHLLNDDIKKDIVFISRNMTLEILNDLYNISDCYVSPYRAEGFNLCALEAAATGTPIIVTKGGSTDDYFRNEFGLQIESKVKNYADKTFLDPNLDSLLDNISHVIQNPKKYSNKNSVKFIKENFSWKKIVEKTYNVFKKSL